MRIDYCPKCHKAGLKYDSGDVTDNKAHYYTHSGKNKWCPRCKEWVKPVIHLYISTRGVA